MTDEKSERQEDTVMATVWQIDVSGNMTPHKVRAGIFNEGWFNTNFGTRCMSYLKDDERGALYQVHHSSAHELRDHNPTFNLLYPKLEMNAVFVNHNPNQHDIIIAGCGYPRRDVTKEEIRDLLRRLRGKNIVQEEVGWWCTIL